MRYGRRILLSLALGALTSFAVAVGLSLWPTRAILLQSRVQVDYFGDAVERGLHVMDERRAGGRTFILITDETRGDNSIGPAWEPWGLPQPGTPRWALKASDGADVADALESFPNPRGIPKSPTSASWPIRPPDWLPWIPETREGLLAYGARGAGWPMVCVRSILEVDPQTRTTRWAWSWRARPSGPFQAMPYNSQDPESGSVPLQPAPVGLVVDTLAYGCAWWLVLFARGAVRGARRWRRVRAGRCGACGYSLGGLAAGAACPECGGGAHAA